MKSVARGFDAGLSLAALARLGGTVETVPAARGAHLRD